MNAFSIASGFPELDESRRRLFAESSVAIQEMDTDGVIRCVNRAECELFGYEPDELIDHYLWEFVAPEQRENTRHSTCQKLAREQPVGVLNREFRRKDGTYLWIEVHESLIENAAGEVIGLRCGLLDITERRKFEVEIQRQHDRMKCLLRSWGRAIVTTDALGHIDFMNPAAETLTGWPEGDGIGRRVEAICRVLNDCGDPVDLIASIFAEPTRNRTAQFTLIHRSGASHNVDWTASLIRNEQGVIIGAALVLEKR
jgi:PAS domain S-box-containing protein